MTRLERDYRHFLDISVHLTGFDSAELLGTGMAPAYYDAVLLQSDPTDARSFFRAVEEILALPAADIERAIAERLMSVTEYGGLAQQIIILWYTGSWANVAVSAEAYKQGLMWVAAQTHPAGAKQPGFGSWASPPISIGGPRGE